MLEDYDYPIGMRCQVRSQLLKGSYTCGWAGLYNVIGEDGIGGRREPLFGEGDTDKVSGVVEEAEDKQPGVFFF